MAGLDDLKLHWIFHLKLEGGLIIAGGFFRDNLLGVPPKDIDIYVTEAAYDELLLKLRSKITTLVEYSTSKEILTSKNITKPPSASKYDEDNETSKIPIHSVVKISTWMGEQLDIIVLRESMTPENILKSFDYTINQFAWYWDGTKGSILASTTGIRDLWDRRLRKYNPDMKINSERERYLIEKGFKLEE